MVEHAVIICLGDSNMQGLAALSEVPAADMTRWIGSTLPVTFPMVGSTKGVRMWSACLPHVAGDVRNITAAGASTVTFSGAVLTANQVDSWIFIKTNTTGQGNYSKITAGTGTNVATVSPAWVTAVAANGTLEFQTGSHTLASVSADGLTWTTTGVTPNIVPVDVIGKWVTVISTSASLFATKRITAATATSITVSDAPAIVPSAGDGIRILSAPQTADSLANIASGSVFRDLTFYADSARSFSTGFEYPNYQTIPQCSPLQWSLSPSVNCIPELTWQFRSAYEGNIYCLVMGSAGSRVSPNPLGTTVQDTTYYWRYDVENNDFHPSTTVGLYAAIKAAISSMAAALALDAPGDTFSFKGVFVNSAGNDGTEAVRAATLGANLTLLRDSLRTFLGLPSLPFIIAGLPQPTSTIPYKDTLVTQMRQMAIDDTYTGFFEMDSTTFPLNPDNLHLNAVGQIALGKAFYTTWKAVQSRANAASRVRSSLPTVTSLIAMVRRRYERNDSSNDANTAQITMFLEDAVREVNNTLGENAWYLRRVEPVTLSTTYPGTILLPRVMKRLIRIERTSCPGESVVYKGISYTDEGRIQIALHDYSGGPFLCHFIAMTPSLSDTGVCLIPNDHVELVVLLTCKRLAECSGNQSMAIYYAAESERLWMVTKKEAIKYDRFRQETMTVVGAYDSVRVGAFPDWLANL